MAMAMARTLQDGVHGGDDGADQLGALVPVVLAPHRVHARALQHEGHDRHVERRAMHTVTLTRSLTYI